MEIIQTSFPGLFVIQPHIIKDDRGYFLEKFHAGIFEKAGLNVRFVQDNQSLSKENVLRGLHYQLAPYAQAKLIHVLEGEVVDIAVDLRRNSPSFGKWYSINLSSENHTQLFIPRGFAHGFSVLSDYAVLEYKCDHLYRADAERGILFSDPSLNIDWQIDLKKAVISPKDRILPLFSKAEMNFVYGEI